MFSVLVHFWLPFIKATRWNGLQVIGLYFSDASRSLKYLGRVSIGQGGLQKKIKGNYKKHFSPSTSPRTTLNKCHSPLILIVKIKNIYRKIYFIHIIIVQLRWLPGTDPPLCSLNPKELIII